MKGVELPINTLIIVVIVLIVFLAILALFFGVWNPGSSVMALESVKSAACQNLVSRGCEYIGTAFIIIKDFDADKDGELDDGSGIDGCGETGGPSQDNLYMLCKCFYNTQDEDECKYTICRCPE